MATRLRLTSDSYPTIEELLHAELDDVSKFCEKTTKANLVPLFKEMCSQLKELKSVTNAVSEIKQLAVDISTKVNKKTFTEAPQSFADIVRQQLQPMKEDMATLNTSVKERESCRERRHPQTN